MQCRFTFQANSLNCYLFKDCITLDESCADCVSGEKTCEEEDAGTNFLAIEFPYRIGRIHLGRDLLVKSKKAKKSIKVKHWYNIKKLHAIVIVIGTS